MRNGIYACEWWKCIYIWFVSLRCACVCVFQVIRFPNKLLDLAVLFFALLFSIHINEIQIENVYKVDTLKGEMATETAVAKAHHLHQQQQQNHYHHTHSFHPKCDGKLQLTVVQIHGWLRLRTLTYAVQFKANCVWVGLPFLCVCAVTPYSMLSFHAIP